MICHLVLSEESSSKGPSFYCMFTWINKNSFGFDWRIRFVILLADILKDHKQQGLILFLENLENIDFRIKEHVEIGMFMSLK
jgi:hypothetical protein